MATGKRTEEERGKGREEEQSQKGGNKKSGKEKGAWEERVGLEKKERGE